MEPYIVNGFYGSGNTPCTVLVYPTRSGGAWYCVDGSVQVNYTCDEISLGVDVEMLQDVDFFTAPEEIGSLEQLEIYVDE